ncbi:MAG: NAD(P) transhydrogenase subunit alpha [Cellvibrionales bacterium TMED148]|nr:NAD(P)(+) transhydrogenase (Re/Si-specific) subunit alpha [Porticoccaceae bacterium]RPG90361.1 MAG: NAD(P) transhydrogenase subunit alpha [Cellvibrionales bacterium TMED148]
MIIGIPSETKPRENRVAMVPDNVLAMIKKGAKVLLESGAGMRAGYRDGDYEIAGAELVNNRRDVFDRSDIILQVQSFGANQESGAIDLERLKGDHLVIGMMDPLANPSAIQTFSASGASALALELVPRISRAQSMDVLSSMATLAGYKSVLLAAAAAPRMFPLLMTAAGTLSPARVLVMGAGVAGLQACATAKRLGGIVEAYDVRPAAQEQIISVGAKPIDLDLDTGTSEGSGGYAKDQSEEFLERQRDLMTAVIAEQDVIITTAAVPGAKSPILVTKEMVKAMKAGSVIVDLAAERGGNCELTQSGKTINTNDITIIGPENIPSSLAFHASQMYGKNIETLLNLILDDEGNLAMDRSDEIISETLVAEDGEICHAAIRNLLGLESPEK